MRYAHIASSFINHYAGQAEMWQRLNLHAHVAQGIEHRFPKPGVASSNLAVGTRKQVKSYK